LLVVPVSVVALAVSPMAPVVVPVGVVAQAVVQAVVVVLSGILTSLPPNDQDFSLCKTLLLLTENRGRVSP
jgi:hypothetical protein